jgi:metal-responsive CopG/Arc/MetJ family transcriptional regulator
MRTAIQIGHSLPKILSLQNEEHAVQDEVYTRHAVHRCQKRAIPQAAVDLVMQFGRIQRHKHGDIYSLDKKSKNYVRSYLGHAIFKSIEYCLGIYVVVGDNGRIITVARRLTRLYHA